jgi:glycine dehydrogenase subunit 1
MESSKFTSPYSPNTEADRRKMLEAIGVSSVDDLFEDIPIDLRDPKLDLPSPLSELEIGQYAGSLAAMNKVPGDYACFLGAGSYRHHIPAVVRQITSRSEYVTSYTPYQPEVSQGTLQTEYEFQSLSCQLTGMEVANAGMYDGSTSLAEGVLMAARVTKRDRIAVLDSVSPVYVEVLKTYAEPQGLVIDVVADGQDLSDDIACLVTQQPNFYGYLEDMEKLSELIHSKGGLLVAYVDAMSLAMFKPPGEYDADIVASEGQTLGVPTGFGGPYMGIFTCKERHMRQMPGRIIGKATDTKGRTAYVLTLQTREQHIRRDRATSNICTSEALIGLMSTVYMAANGKRGMRHIAELCYHKAHYAASLIEKIPGYSQPISGTFFQEFVVQCPIQPSLVNERLLDHKIIGGLDISDQVPDGMLLCVSELNSREEIERLAAALADIGAAS